MEKTKQDKLVLLEDTIKYYSEDINRRCVNSTTDLCYYSSTSIPDKWSDGCAIGRLLTPKLRLELDAKSSEMSNTSVKHIFHLLPENIQDYGKDFLDKLQKLHDNARNWNDEGLSEHGKIMVDEIKFEINEYII